jgi:short-subunit dehydrogenase
MTQIVLPRMVAKNKGVIINLSSAAAKLQGLPFLSVYSGTKVCMKIL